MWSITECQLVEAAAHWYRNITAPHIQLWHRVVYVARIQLAGLVISNWKIINHIQNKLMLEHNHLYRRIQHRNLFRTFSSTYSRHTPQTPLRLDNQELTHQSNNPTSIPIIPSYTHHSPSHPSLNTLQNSAPRLELTTQTEAIFKRSEDFHHIETPSASITHIVNLRGEDTKGKNSVHNNYLNSLMERRKASGSSTASNITHLLRKQNFKLKSNNQAKEVSYQGKVDQTEFSILEYNRRSQLKKECEQRQHAQNLSRIGMIKRRFMQVPNTEMKNVGNRVAGHLFNKYNKTIVGHGYITRQQIYNRTLDN